MVGLKHMDVVDSASIRFHKTDTGYQIMRGQYK